MTALPAATAFTGSSVTEAQFKTAITDQRDFLAGLLGTSGTQADALAALGTLLNGAVAKSANYTVASTDRGKLIDYTGTCTLSLLAAATAGNGFAIAVRNSGNGTITIDPSGSETVDGDATLSLAARESCVLVCGGSGWKTAVKTVTPPSVSYPISVSNGGTGATTASGAADNMSVVKRDHGHGNVGSFITAVYLPSGITPQSVTAGNTYVGSALKYYSDGDYGSYGLSGTWRALHTGTGQELFQRIA